MTSEKVSDGAVFHPLGEEITGSLIIQVLWILRRSLDQSSEPTYDRLHRVMKLLSSILNAGSGLKKTAVFGDIHSNIEALDAVLADTEKNGVSRFFCTGDVVGYGAAPSACIQRLQKLNALTVRGNHDQYCAGNRIPEEVNACARAATLWTGKQLTTAELIWLLNLPMKQQEGGLGVVHSTYEPGQSWPYILDADHAEPSMRKQPAPLAFYGHTHRPMVFVENSNGIIRKKKFNTSKIKKGCRYFINPGSVGQPRDGDPRAAYALYDPAKKTVTLRRVEYDIETAAERILRAGLPSRNAERLSIGK